MRARGLRSSSPIRWVPTGRYTRILGELKKLKVGRLSRQSVKNILIEHGLDPGPKRGQGTWSEFLRIHSETLWQRDFFSKYEALNHFIVFGQEHFDHIVSEYVTYYHEFRPYQGLGNVLLPQPRGKPDDELATDQETAATQLDLTEVKCDERLGGLLKHFYREAA